MFYDNTLTEMSLRLNRSEPSFRTKRELPGVGRRPRTHTTTTELTHKFHDSTAKANTNFYI